MGWDLKTIILVFYQCRIKMNEKSNSVIDALSILNAIPGCHLILLPDAPRFTIVGATDAYLAVTYLEREAVIGKGVFETYTDNPWNPVATGVKNLSDSFCFLVEQKQEMQMADQRYDILNPDTGEYELRIWTPQNKPVLNADGQVKYIIHTVEDITEKVRLREEGKITHHKLQDSQRFFRNLVEQAPVAILLSKGEDVVIESVNTAMLQFLDKAAPEQVLGKKMLEVLPELIHQQALQTVLQVQKTGIPFRGEELPVDLVINGKLEHRYFNLSYTPVTEAGKISAVLHVAVDVTKQVASRREAEEAIKEAERQKRLYETINSTTPDLIYVFDLAYRFTYANQALLDMWGSTWEHSIGKGFRENGYEEWHALLHEREIDQVAATKKPIRGEVSFPHATLGRRVYDYIFVPVINKNGEVEAVAGTTRDVTEQKEAGEKLEKLVAERTSALQRSNEDLQQFAHVASHDLREPVRKIKTFATRLQHDISPALNEGSKVYLDKINSAADRMFAMIDGVLTYSSLNALNQTIEKVDLTELLKQIETDLEVAVQRTGAVLSYSELPVMEGVPVLLYQLFYNLIYNSLKFARAGIPPVISLESQSFFEDGQGFAKLHIKDNGIGFDQQYAEKIFESFTRLHSKDKYEGTGLGLALCKKIAVRHGGGIEARGMREKGAEFIVSLPLRQGKSTL